MGGDTSRTSVCTRRQGNDVLAQHGYVKVHDYHFLILLLKHNKSIPDLCEYQ